MVNCLTRALDQWDEDKSMRLWYNSNHVIAIEDKFDLHNIGYLPLSDFGFDHLMASFNVPGYSLLLAKYLDNEHNRQE